MQRPFWLCLAIPICLADPMIGVCNMTHFIAGGQRCQRAMMSNLKHKQNTDCRVEYQHLTSCLTHHASSCLMGLHTGFVPAVASLIKLLYYHCGDLKLDPAAISPLLLNQIQCKPEVFTKTVQCWDNFRDRFNTDKEDPQLCRDYALSKECATHEAKTACSIGQYINRDLYNPFCAYNMDPLLNSSEPIATVLIGHCSSQKFAFSAYTCQREMITNLATNGGSCREEYLKMEHCLSSTMDMCLSGTSLSKVKDQVLQLVQSVLYHCGSFKPSPNSLLLSVLNCNETMFDNAVKCWDNFRLRLIVNKSDKQLCVDYVMSKRCVLEAVKRSCTIGGLMEEDLYNPFCANGIDPLFLPLTSAMISDQFAIVCNSDFLYTKAIKCEDQFLKTIYSTTEVTNCRNQSHSLLTCLKRNFAPCVRPFSNPALLQALSLVVLQSLQGTQLVCDSPIKSILWDDLPPLLQTVALCSSDYTNKVIHCGTEFRSKFVPVPSPLCEEFENAKKCVDEARQSLCLFDLQARSTLVAGFNPFCDNRTRPLFTDDGSSLRISLELEVLLSLTLLFSYVS